MPKLSIPADAKIPCHGAVEIPDKPLTFNDLARLWARDREALGECNRLTDLRIKVILAFEGQQNALDPP